MGQENVRVALLVRPGFISRSGIGRYGKMVEIIPILEKLVALSPDVPRELSRFSLFWFGLGWVLGFPIGICVCEFVGGRLADPAVSVVGARQDCRPNRSRSVDKLFELRGRRGLS